MTEFNLNKFVRENVQSEYTKLVKQQENLIKELKEVIARRIEFESHIMLQNILNPEIKDVEAI